MATVLLCAPTRGDARTAPYLEAAVQRGMTALVVTPDDHGVPHGIRAAGVVGIGRRAAALASAVAARHGLPWHVPDAVRLAQDRLQVLGRLTATGMPVPRFAAVDVASGADLERLVGIPAPWRVTSVTGGRHVIVADISGLEALAPAARPEPATSDARDAEAERGRLVVEPHLDGPWWAVVGLLDAGALRVVGLIDVRLEPSPGAGTNVGQPTCVASSPSSLTREAQGHLAGLVAQGCASLGLRQGPVLAYAASVDGRACVLDVAPRSLEDGAADVLGLVGPAGSAVTLASLVLAHAVGDALDGYAMDGNFRTVSIARPDPNRVRNET